MITASRIELVGNGVALAADRWDVPSHVVEKGIVLLLHGGGQTRHSWRTTGSDLACQGWTAIAFDARGHGDSEWAPDGSYDIDAFVADLRRVTSTLDTRPVLVGASMGGMTSLLAQGEDPLTARAMVLVDIAPRVESTGTQAIAEFMRSGLSGFDSLDSAVAAVAAYNPHRSRPPRPEGLLKNLRQRDGRFYWHWDPRFVDGGDEPTRSVLDREARYQRARNAAVNIMVPTLLVRGEQSNIVSPQGAQELLDLIPHAQMIDVAGAGHMVAGDDNNVFASGLLKFLETEKIAAA